MSEFKYACPVCGQHIKCDSTQSGTVMECPTCLQKIVAPQAPSGPDQKFILSGKKLAGAPKTQVPAAPPLEPPRRSFPVAAVALLMFIAVTTSAVVIYHGKFFRSGGNQTAPLPPAKPPDAPQAAAPEKPTPPAVVIPQASDTNWLLNLDTANFPGAPAAGRIHGQDFLCERSYLQSGALTLREGTKGAADFALVISFNGAPPEALAGRTINLASNAPIAARVTLRWRDTGQAVKDTIEAGYALRLAFGPLANNRLPGQIYFCAPDEMKSYVAGTFSAEIRKPKVAKPK